MTLEKYTAQFPTDIEDMVPGLRIKVGDDRAVFERVRDRLFVELAPETSYECLMAGQLVTLELDAIRLRNMMDRTLEDRLIEKVKLVLSQKATDAYANAPQPPQSDIGMGLAEAIDTELARIKAIQTEIKQAGPEAPALILQILAEAGLDPTLVQAEIWSESAERVEPHEMRLIATEQRRRRLLADYEHLKATRLDAMELEEVDYLDDVF